MSPTPISDDLDKNLGDVFHILGRLITELFEKDSLAKITSLQLTQQQLNMLTLLDAAGLHTMTELCRLHNISPPAATKNVDKLESLGLVKRHLTDGDRRLVRVEITAAGSQLVYKYRNSYLEKVTEALSGFSTEEKSDLLDEMEDFIRNGIAANPDAALICLQCQGRFSDSCVLQEHFDRCLYARTE
ncbi:MAG: winged helix-turn-helix transcriptional regulator [Fidelibacterota bacterium]|nr:MAG: winged helix-turn-helix transcriptional regulator [Candidatus Neomarinimicrobiota bacterium]